MDYQLDYAFDEDMTEEEISSAVDKDALTVVPGFIREKEVQKILTVVKQMQKWSWQIWNPEDDKVSLTHYMGLVTMDKDMMKENLALGLDHPSNHGLLAKFSKGKCVEDLHPGA